MIANQHEKGWEIIYHRAHALLAAELAGHWNAKDRPIRWLETIAAISHHDDLEKEWEGNHLTEAGGPLDFTLEKKTDINKLRSHTQNARYRGRWVAMLIVVSKAIACLVLSTRPKQGGLLLRERWLPANLPRTFNPPETGRVIVTPPP